MARHLTKYTKEEFTAQVLALCEFDKTITHAWIIPRLALSDRGQSKVLFHEDFYSFADCVQTPTTDEVGEEPILVFERATS